ncbi:cytochrome P450 [Mycena rosella]|uniref:Cytochrome P450 n=1 Tax=Mycena rosella TaxID=1033263 RepID=A0AAD7GF78_MYCRO|nr:cytochrome P450 [Mycena rosella]
MLASLWIIYTIALLLIVWVAAVGGGALRRALNTTAMPGPARSLFGPFPESELLDISKCCGRYGPVFRAHTGPFSNKLVICDTAAIAHFYANAPTIYRATSAVRQATRNLVGRGLISVDGDHHPRQVDHREALSPVFNDAAVEIYSRVFLDMATKVKNMWNDALESRPRGMVLDIRHWMNSVVLDSLSVAGFSHNFESLNGNYCIITAVFYALRAPSTSSVSDIIFRLAAYWPIFRNIPTAKNRVINDFQVSMSRISKDVLERNTRKRGDTDDSLLGLLIKSLAEHPAGEFRLSHAEVLAQMVSILVCLLKAKNNDILNQNTLLFAGFENTAVSLSWLLVELARNPTIQEKLRNELQQTKGEIAHGQIKKLPYLHAVVYESLRLHPPMGDTTRVAVEDDVIPLSFPIAARSGDAITSIKVAKGTVVTVPIRHVNTSEAFWGPGSLKFNPERYWQDRSNTEFPGNRHLAFGDGPRACIGANFSLSLIKVVLSVVVSNFTLSLPEGPQTVIETSGGCIPRPRVSGQGPELLMVVRKL